jgi:hypothetical protein
MLDNGYRVSLHCLKYNPKIEAQVSLVILPVHATSAALIIEKLNYSIYASAFCGPFGTPDE